MAWWQAVLIVVASVVVGLLVGGLISYLIAWLRKKPLVKQQETIEVAVEPAATQQKSGTPDLFAELEKNHRVAVESRADEMLPFETRVWDASQDKVHGLTANLREELAQAYLDIRQANDIVWLSKELGHRSQTLDEHYMNLCPRIAARLEKVMPLLKESDS
jgi:high-affinity Fe2+/Pb2+ permease